MIEIVIAFYLLQAIFGAILLIWLIINEFNN